MAELHKRKIRDVIMKICGLNGSKMPWRVSVPFQKAYWCDHFLSGRRVYCEISRIYSVRGSVDFRTGRMT